MVSVQPGVGPGVWWSPVLGRVASEVPAAPWGGFLAEEMVSGLLRGMGSWVEAETHCAAVGDVSEELKVPPCGGFLAEEMVSGVTG